MSRAMKRFLKLLPALGLVVSAGSLYAIEKEEDSEPFRKVFSVQIDKPGGMAFDGKLLWIADRAQLKIRGLDPATGKERETLKAPGTWPNGLAFDGKLLWVSDLDRGRLFGIDTQTKLVKREIEAPSNPQGLAFDGEYLYVADGKQIHQVTTEDGTTIKTLKAPTWSSSGKGTEQLGLAFKDGYLWVSDRTTDKLYKMSAETGDVVDQLPSFGPFPTGLAFVGQDLMVADADRRQVEALSISAMLKIVREQAKKETVVLRRAVANHGPDTLVEAEILIAIPHSAPNQAIEGEPVFKPAPTKIVEDQWGQKFAKFEVKNLKAGEQLDVTMTVKTTLFEARYHIDPSAVGSLQSIPEDIKKKYLADASKFAIHHPSIQKHLKEALGGEKRPYWMIRKITRYIQDHMFYELAGGWNIAPTVIDRGSGSCSEYTFVFMSMCRAAGIPTRYVGSIVIRGDDASTDQVFHRWPEVYLPGYGWVPADAQAGDSEQPEKQGRAFGTLDNRILITTWGGGASRYIGWDYNSTAKWVCNGRCEVKELSIGDWYPADQNPIVP